MDNSADTTRTAVDGAAAALNAAQKELDDRARELDEREAALKKAVDGVDAEKRMMAGRKTSDVIPLNIGGTKTHALRSTLDEYALRTSRCRLPFLPPLDHSSERPSVRQPQALLPCPRSWRLQR